MTNLLRRLLAHLRLLRRARERWAAMRLERELCRAGLDPRPAIGRTQTQAIGDVRAMRRQMVNDMLRRETAA